MNILALGIAVRTLLFGGSFIFASSVAAFIAYDGRGRWRETLPWLVLSVTASALTLPALCYSLLGLGVRYQSWAAPLACTALGGVPLALLTVGLYVALARSAAPPQLVAPHAAHNAPRPRFQPVCRNPACRAPLEHNQRTCHLCGWDQERPVPLGETLHPGPARPALPSSGPDDERSTLAYLVVRNGPQAGVNFQLGQETDIGSGAANDISLQDPFVGREHARIRRKGKSYVFYDMSTPNGSFLITPTGRQRLDVPHTLRHGDMLELGDTVLVFMQVE